MPDYTFVRGDTVVRYYKFLTAAGSVMDLAGCTIWVTAKPGFDADATDTSATFKHSLVIDGAGAVTSSSGMALGGIDPETPFGTATLASEGIVTHTISPAESSTIGLNRQVYDVQVKDASGNIRTLVQGSIITTADVTRRTTVP